MKTIGTILFLSFLTYGIMVYFENRPLTLDVPIHATKASSSVPDDETVTVSTPDLKRIVVKGSPHPLTNARVREVHTSGIVFLSDQGLFKVSFESLPPEFSQYYGPIAIKDEPSPTPDPSITPTPAVAVATPIPVKPRPQRTALEDAAARASYEGRRSGLKDRMQSDRDTMDRFYKQSSFNPGPISQTTFDNTRADYNLAAEQLSVLESQGP